MCTNRHAGFTLIEMVIAIVVIGIGLAGVLLAFDTTVRQSADPLMRKQMLAAAEEMMEEALLKPYAVTGTAPTNSSTTCGTAGAVRKGFDDVSDYNGYKTIPGVSPVTPGICDIDGVAVPGLDNFGIEVTVDSAATLGSLGGGGVKKVTVVVSRGTETLSLVGWRTDYAS